MKPEIKGTLSLKSRLKSTSLVNVVRHFSQLMLGILVARYLSVDDKGLQFIFTSLSSAAAILLSFGLTNSIVFHVKKRSIDFSQVLQYLLLAQIVIGAICILLAFTLWPFFENAIFGERPVTLVMSTVFYLLVCVSLNNYLVSTLCLTFSLFYLYAYFFAFSSLVLLVVVYVGLIFWSFNIYDVLTIILVVEGCAGLMALMYLWMRRDIFRAIESERVAHSSIIRYARNCYLGVSSNTIASHGDTLIVSSLLDQYALGLYSVSKTFYRLFAVIPQLVNGVIFGLFCESLLSDAFKIVKKIVRYLIALSVFVGVASFFCLEYLIQFIYGKEFLEAYAASLLLIFSASILACSSPINPLLLAFDRPLDSSTIMLVSGSIGLCCSLYFTMQYGLIGTAVAVLVTAVITSILRLYFAARLSKLC